MTTRTWPYGTRLNARVDAVVQMGAKGPAVLARDEHGEGHILFGCGTAEVGSNVILIFSKGGPLGGYWQITKDGAE